MQALTSEQINQLAPDAASIKAAQSLASRWQLLAGNGQALWGLCKGSGKNPYQTAIDGRDFASKCSCPSRKFPCKHALSLLLVRAAGAQFKDEEMPDWVQSWLDKRGQTKEKKEKKAADPAQRQKRQAAREKKVAGGLEDLNLWLRDLLRQGLLQIDRNDFDQMARRLVDQQLTPLGQQLQRLALAEQEELLYGLSQLYLMTRAAERLDHLSPERQEDLKLRLGFPVAKEEVLARPPVNDRWLAPGRREEVQDRAVTIFYYLYGLQTRRFALLLDFAMPPQVPPSLQPLAAGQCYGGDLHFYGGLNNLRALAPALRAVDEKINLPAQNLNESWRQLMADYAANPLLNQLIGYGTNLHYVFRDKQSGLSDGQRVLPINISEEEKIRLLAHSGGRAFSAFFLHRPASQRNELLLTL